MGKLSYDTKLRFTRWDCLIFVCYWILVVLVRIIYNKDTYDLDTEKLIISSIFTFVIDNIAVFLIIYTLTGILFGSRPWLVALNLLFILGLSVIYTVFYQMLIYGAFKLTLQTFYGGIMNHGRSYFLLAIIFSIRMIRRFHADTLRLQMEKLREEMKAIRSRISPHSVINLLSFFALDNGKYSNSQLISMIKPLLSYLLYDSQQDWLPLADKIKFLQDYIEVQRKLMPYPHILHVRVEPPQQPLKIAPGVLLPFVENAFRHGGRTHTDRIEIELYVQGRELFLLTRNTVTTEPETRKGGIGLRDSLRNLELNYPGRYTHFSETDNGVYTSELSIKLEPI